MLNGVYGASKAFVLALSQSLRHELAAKGVTVQAVLPGATATEFWDIAGLPVTNLPEAWVMTAENMVDASLSGLDQGEFVTIPALDDAAQWEAYEAARQLLRPNLSRTQPAPRYRVSPTETADIGSMRRRGAGGSTPPGGGGEVSSSSPE